MFFYMVSFHLIFSMYVCMFIGVILNTQFCIFLFFELFLGYFFTLKIP